jgi:hypothetical protein
MTPRIVAAGFLLGLILAGAALARIDTAASSNVVPPGTLVDSIAASTLAGEPSSFAPSADSRWIVVYVNEQCGHCHAQLEAWQTTHAAAPAALADLSMFVVSESTYTGPAQSTLPADFPHTRLLDDDRRIASAFGITRVPTTIVLEGPRVRAAFEGVQPPSAVLREYEERAGRRP